MSIMYLSFLASSRSASVVLMRNVLAEAEADAAYECVSGSCAAWLSKGSGGMRTGGPKRFKGGRF